MSPFQVRNGYLLHAIRHDLFPMQSGLLRTPGSKDAIGWGVVTIGSKDIVLEYTVPKAPVLARAIYANPADALSSGSISDFAENGFVR